MISHDSIDVQALVHRAVPGCNGNITWQPTSTGKHNTSFFVTAGERDLVIRVAPRPGPGYLFYEVDMMRQEPGIHRVLVDRTSVPVAPVVFYDDSRELVDTEYIVMERLPGKPLTQAEGFDYSNVMRQVGESLAQAHALTAEECGYGSGYGYLGEHQPHEIKQTWVETFHLIWNRLIDEVVACGHYDEEESAYMRRMLDDVIDVFDRDVPASLLHMDVWAENILVDETGKQTGLVDWDRALWGDPEIEFAVLDFCNISEPAFWEGYGRERDWSREAQIRQVFYLLYELQKYIPIVQGRRGNTERALKFKSQVMDIVKKYNEDLRS